MLDLANIFTQHDKIFNVSKQRAHFHATWLPYDLLLKLAIGVSDKDEEKGPARTFVKPILGTPLKNTSIVGKHTS